MPPWPGGGGAKSFGGLGFDAPPAHSIRKRCSSATSVQPVLEPTVAASQHECSQACRGLGTLGLFVLPRTCRGEQDSVHVLRRLWQATRGRGPSGGSRRSSAQGKARKGLPMLPFGLTPHLPKAELLSTIFSEVSKRRAFPGPCQQARH